MGLLQSQRGSSFFCGLLLAERTLRVPLFDNFQAINSIELLLLFLLLPSDLLKTHREDSEALLVLCFLVRLSASSALIIHRSSTLSSTLPHQEPGIFIVSYKISIFATTERSLARRAVTNLLPVQNFLQLLIFFLAFTYSFNWSITTVVLNTTVMWEHRSTFFIMVRLQPLR